MYKHEYECKLTNFVVAEVFDSNFQVTDNDICVYFRFPGSVRCTFQPFLVHC